MTSRSLTLRTLILASLLTLSAEATIARDAAVYHAAEFTAAQQQQKHVIIEVFKKGCPTCAAQQPALEAARKQFPDAVFMIIDFQRDTDAVTQFKVVKQSTILVFKGGTEVARLVGETDQTAILTAIAKGA
jgi:thiol-disulfide isomerase/thioredoxin